MWSKPPPPQELIISPPRSTVPRYITLTRKKKKIHHKQLLGKEGGDGGNDSNRGGDTPTRSARGKDQRKKSNNCGARTTRMGGRLTQQPNGQCRRAPGRRAQQLNHMSSMLSKTSLCDAIGMAIALPIVCSIANQSSKFHVIIYRITASCLQIFRNCEFRTKYPVVRKTDKNIPD